MKLLDKIKKFFKKEEKQKDLCEIKQECEHVRNFFKNPKKIVKIINKKPTQDEVWLQFLQDLNTLNLYCFNDDINKLKDVIKKTAIASKNELTEYHYKCENEDGKIGFKIVYLKKDELDEHMKRNDDINKSLS